MNFITEFQFIADAYNGTGGFADGSELDQFKRESDGSTDPTDDAYGDRKEASKHEYENLFSSKVSRYNGYLFKSQPGRKTEDKLLEGILKDANRRGESVNVFMSNFAKNAKARGVNLLLVDIPQEKAKDRKEQIDKRLTPYFVEMLPETVQEYKINNFGSFDFVTFGDTIDSSTYENSDTQDIVRYYDKKEWRIYDLDKNILDRGDHGFSRCPVLIFSEKGNFESLGEFSQLAGLSKRMFNNDSELKLLLRGQTFSILTIWTEKGSSPTINLGIDNALLYSGDHPPSYISSDVAQAKTYEDKILAIKESMDRVAYDVSTTQAQESGIALSLKFEGLNSSLNSFAQRLENLERDAWDLVCESLGLPFDSVTIVYNMDFSITDLNNEIDILDSVNNIADLPIYKAEKLKAIAREDLKGYDDEIMETIYEEIDTSIGKMSEVE